MPVQSVQNVYSVSLKLLLYSLALCSNKLLSVFNIDSHSKFSDCLLIGKEDAWTQFLWYNYMINKKNHTHTHTKYVHSHIILHQHVSGTPVTIIKVAQQKYNQYIFIN